MAPPVFTPGRILITLANLFYCIGAFVADFNETHVYNPRWPPHARFHNGQTMTLGILLTAMSLYFAYLPAFSHGGKSANAKDCTLWSATIGSFYCAAGLAAILYPGTAWHDPEFAMEMTQKPVFFVQVLLVWAGYAVEIQRLKAVEGKGKTG